MTAFVAASLDPPSDFTELWPLSRFEPEAKRRVQSLSYSEDVKNLLLRLLSESEENRPVMQDVLQLAYNQLTKLYEEANSAAKASHDYAKAQKTLQELSNMVNSDLHDLEYIDSRPFYVNDFVINAQFFKGMRKKDHRPITCMRYRLSNCHEKWERKNLVKIIENGVLQARLNHPNICKILEMRIDLNPAKTEYFVDYVMESLDKNLERERSKSRILYCERELLEKLQQISSALKLAHEKVTYM